MYLKSKFRKINYVKVKEGISIEPQEISLTLDDENFEKLLHPAEKGVWKYLKNICWVFMDIIKNRGVFTGGGDKRVQTPPRSQKIK